MCFTTERTWNQLEVVLKGTISSIWLFLTNIAICDDRVCLPATGRTEQWNKTSYLQLSPNKNSSSLSKEEGGLLGTLKGILQPQRVTNWARQGSLQDWLKLVCGSTFAPNKDEKPEIETVWGRRKRRRYGWKIRTERRLALPWHINCASVFFLI